MPQPDFYDQYYVNYWFANYPKASSVVDMVESLRISEAYRRQLNSFNKRKKALQGKHSDSRAFQEWSKFLESTSGNNENILQKAAELDKSGLEAEKIQLIDDVLKSITTDDERFPNTLKGLQELVKVSNDILEICFGKEKMAIFNAWKDELLERYVNEGASISGYAEQVVRSILGTHSEEFVKVKSSSSAGGKLSEANRRLGGLLVALDLLSSGIGDQPLDVVRKSGTTTLTTGDQIVRRIRESIRKSLQNYSKYAHELLNGSAVEKLGNQMLELLPGASVSTKNTGKQLNRTNYAEVVYQMDPAFQKHFDAINQGRSKAKLRKAIWDMKTSKSDFTATLTSTENEITLTTTIGFSVKTESNIKMTSNSISKADIKLQEGTPLFTFLVRDLGLSSYQMNSLIRLAAGHGSNTIAGGGQTYSSSKLNSVWNKLVKYVQAKSLLTALTGVSLVGETDTLYFILNGRMFSIGDIIQAVADLAASGDNAVKLSTFKDEESPGLKRSTYLSINVWKVPRKKKPLVAVKRSQEVFSKVVNKMYDTKIKVDLNTSAIQRILSGI